MSHSRHRHHRPVRKTGLPPGSLIATTAPQTEQPRLSALLFDAAGVEKLELADAAAVARLPWPQTGKRLWLNLYGIHSAELIRAVGQRFGLHPLVQEDIMNPSQRPKLEDYGDYLFLVARLFEPAGDTPGAELVSDQFSLVLGRDLVLTFQEKPSGCFAPVRERLRSGNAQMRSQDCGYLTYSLLDTLIDRYFEGVDTLGERAEQLEDEALGQPRPELLGRINQVKHDCRQLRRAVWPLREVLVTLQRTDNPFFTPSTRLYLRDVYDHAVVLIETMDAVRELLADLMDIYLSSVSNRLNLELRVLTVLSTLFLPATLIAGIFGMNFRRMPWLESPDGFWLSLLLMVAIAVAMAATFWRRKWLRS